MESGKRSLMVTVIAVVGFIQVLTAFLFLNYFAKEVFFGFLQVSNFEAIEWLFAFVAVFYTILWNIFVGLLLITQCCRRPNDARKGRSHSSPGDDDGNIISAFAYLAWGWSTIIFLAIDIIGNFIIYVNGAYERSLLLTWIPPLVCFAAVVHAFSGLKQDQENSDYNEQLVPDRKTVSTISNIKDYYGTVW